MPRTTTGPKALSFKLVSIYDDAYLNGTMWLVNPTIIIKNWNKTTQAFTLKVNRIALSNGRGYRVGYERTKTGTAMVLWLHKTYDLTAAEDHQIAVALTL